jgi:REP element-mobilizing transposase RayT
MPAYARHVIVADDEVGVYHCITRCVRRAFLCGTDPITGHNYEHRKDWIRERLEQLASIFAIDICGYVVMSNHLHLILRIRPDLVRDCSDEEIALRWVRLYPPRDPATGKPTEPSECDLNMILSDPARIVKLRERLASLSWFMRCLNEPIARRANREDHCSGRFWEGRYRSQVLLDDAAVLACSVYVDLNPIRAGVAETPEQSEHTSVFDRIRSRPAASVESTPSGHRELVAPAGHEPKERSLPRGPQRPDAWLCELTIEEKPSQQFEPGPSAVQEPNLEGASDADAAKLPLCSLPVARASRASDQGYLPIALDTYLSLVDWTGREIRGASRGTIPAHFAPILERLHLKDDRWIETVRQFGRWFKRAVGRRASLKILAEQTGRRWFHGQRAAGVAFL